MTVTQWHICFWIQFPVVLLTFEAYMICPVYVEDFLSSYDPPCCLRFSFLLLESSLKSLCLTTTQTCSITAAPLTFWNGSLEEARRAPTSAQFHRQCKACFDWCHFLVFSQKWHHALTAIPSPASHWNASWQSLVGNLSPPVGTRQPYSVITRVDFYHMLYMGLPLKIIQILQLVQNMAENG